jgi:hypothetical protein
LGKSIFVLVIWLLAGGIGNAAPAIDTSMYSEVIVLTNGGLIKGRIVDPRHAGAITVVDRSGSQIDIPLRKVALVSNRSGSFAQVQRRILDSLERTRPPKAHLTRISIWRSAVTFGSDVTTESVLGMAGFRSDHGQVVGVGIGYDRFSGGKFVPVFGELGYALGESQSFYISMRMGYSIGWVNNIKQADFGGARFGFSAGLFRNLGKQIHLLVEAGYTGQNTGVSSDWLHQLSLSVGLQFDPLKRHN